MKAPVKVGAMRFTFVVQRKVATQNAYNESIITHEDVTAIRGAIKTLDGRNLQMAAANTNTATATHQITARYCPDVQLSQTRLRLTTASGTRTFELNKINDLDNLKQWMVLTVTEVA
jgi:head-tail adaptor